jgi:hypothetical protein
MKQLTFFFVILLAFAAASVAQEATACDARSAQRPLIGAFRVMNTAQYQFLGQNKHFATAAELLAFSGTKKLSERKSYAQPTPDSLALQEGPEPLSGYELRINVSPDGKSYTILATKKEGSCKFYGVATDDRGLIYLIEPIH